MKKQTITIIVVCVIAVTYFTFAMLHKAQSAIDHAIELGKAPMDTDTAIYWRVYEDNAHRFYLNGHLIDFSDLEKRADRLNRAGGMIYYANQTPSKNIPKDSKIFVLLRNKQIAFNIYQDSLFTKPYY